MGARQRYGLVAVAILSSLCTTTTATAQLTKTEHRALTLSENWRNARNPIKRGPDGSVIYRFGVSEPSVVCAPLKLCEIQLQAGELVDDVLVGDTVRWKIVPATSGSASDQQRVSIIVKPAQPGLSTSMVITTSRRVYHIALKSSIRHYMARVSFSYGDELPTNRVRGSDIFSDGGGYSERSNFTVRGDNPSWRPVKIFNDGTRTYIQLRGVRTGAAPALYVVTGGLFAPKRKIASYRLNGNTMVVDNPFKKAVLVSGLGSPHQARVVIERGN